MPVRARPVAVRPAPCDRDCSPSAVFAPPVSDDLVRRDRDSRLVGATSRHTWTSNYRMATYPELRTAPVGCHGVGAGIRPSENRSKKMVQELTHFVGGKRVPGTSDKFGDVYDPNTGEVQSRVPLADKAEPEAIIANAVDAQREWAAFNPQKRARVLMKFLQLVQLEMDSLAR